ncbi:ribosome biogenesis protein NOP53 [Electrophorus electricus]|uniref:Ribosome biogenesis protein NOP53 n=1 Tax=Electrophorus electricus TaxID=8005 RepID=A0A4W4G4C5_ELEEL|nr:ribosome biogenesis protein NOP53 [Electrophorus electricus]
MAAARRHKRVAASQPGFLRLKPDLDHSASRIGHKKRVNKNKKKNWNKYSDIQDVEEFLEDVRLQERATGGLLSDKSDDGLFFVDVGEQKVRPDPGAVEKKGKGLKPLRIDLILQPDSQVPPPKDILAYQQPNARKLRLMAQKAEKLAAMGVLPRRERLLQRRRIPGSEKPVANNDPARAFYDLWRPDRPDTADPYYLEQTKRRLVKRPEKLNVKPSLLPAVEVAAPGASYNPDFTSHQALLLEAHETEVAKLKAEEKLARQLAVRKEDLATEESVFREQVEGLIEEEEEKLEAEEDDEGTAVGPTAQTEKKTEKQRKREKADRVKELQKKAERKAIDSRQQLFQLRTISAELRRREQQTSVRRTRRKDQQEREKVQPRRLGKLRFQAPDLDVQLSDELSGSLRTLKPEGSILKDRFKSLQKRNLIEPRERAKFKRKFKVKYVEKREFREIQ